MKKYLVLFFLLCLPVLAAEPAAPPAPALDTSRLWRSDSALNDAEKLMQEKKYVDALTILEQVIARNMRNVDAHVDSAIVWVNLGNLDKAKSSLSSAMIIDKNHLGIYVVSGTIALLEQNVDEANNYLSALRMLCRTETCPEFQALQRMIRETKIEKKDGGWFF